MFICLWDSHFPVIYLNVKGSTAWCYPSYLPLNEAVWKTGVWGKKCQASTQNTLDGDVMNIDRLRCKSTPHKPDPAVNFDLWISGVICMSSMCLGYRLSIKEPQSLASQRIAITNRCVFKIVNWKSQLLLQVPQKSAAKSRNEITNRAFQIATPNRDVFCLWNSKDKSKAPKLAKNNKSLRFWGRDLESQRFRVFEIAALSGRKAWRLPFPRLATRRQSPKFSKLLWKLLRKLPGKLLLWRLP